MDNIRTNTYSDIASLLERYKQVTPKKRTANEWQELALEIIKAFNIPNKASVFKCCKTNVSAARFAFNDCKELNKPHANYFFKVWGILHYGPNRVLQTK